MKSRRTKLLSGWRRVVHPNGQIMYVAPSGRALFTRQQVRTYLAKHSKLMSFLHPRVKPLKIARFFDFKQDAIVENLSNAADTVDLCTIWFDMLSLEFQAQFRCAVHAFMLDQFDCEPHILYYLTHGIPIPEDRAEYPNDRQQVDRWLRTFEFNKFRVVGDTVWLTELTHSNVANAAFELVFTGKLSINKTSLNTFISLVKSLSKSSSKQKNNTGKMLKKKKRSKTTKRKSTSSNSTKIYSASTSGLKKKNMKQLSNSQLSVTPSTSVGSTGNINKAAVQRASTSGMPQLNSTNNAPVKSFSNTQNFVSIRGKAPTLLAKPTNAPVSSNVLSTTSSQLSVRKISPPNLQIRRLPPEPPFWSITPVSSTDNSVKLKFKKDPKGEFLILFCRDRKHTDQPRQWTACKKSSKGIKLCRPRMFKKRLCNLKKPLKQRTNLKSIKTLKNGKTLRKSLKQGTKMKSLKSGKIMKNRKNVNKSTISKGINKKRKNRKNRKPFVHRTKDGMTSICHPRLSLVYTNSEKMPKRVKISTKEKGQLVMERVPGNQNSPVLYKVLMKTTDGFKPTGYEIHKKSPVVKRKKLIVVKTVESLTRPVTVSAPVVSSSVSHSQKPPTPSVNSVLAPFPPLASRFPNTNVMVNASIQPTQPTLPNGNNIMVRPPISIVSSFSTGQIRAPVPQVSRILPVITSPRLPVSTVSIRSPPRMPISQAVGTTIYRIITPPIGQRPLNVSNVTFATHEPRPSVTSTVSIHQPIEGHFLSPSGPIAIRPRFPSPPHSSMVSQFIQRPVGVITQQKSPLSSQRFAPPISSSQCTFIITSDVGQVRHQIPSGANPSLFASPRPQVNIVQSSGPRIALPQGFYPQLPVAHKSAPSNSIPQPTGSQNHFSRISTTVQPTPTMIALTSPPSRPLPETAIADAKKKSTPIRASKTKTPVNSTPSPVVSTISSASTTTSPNNLRQQPFFYNFQKNDFLFPIVSGVPMGVPFTSQSQSSQVITSTSVNVASSSLGMPPNGLSYTYSGQVNQPNPAPPTGFNSPSKAKGARASRKKVIVNMTNSAVYPVQSSGIISSVQHPQSVSVIPPTAPTTGTKPVANRRRSKAQKNEPVVPTTSVAPRFTTLLLLPPASGSVVSTLAPNPITTPEKNVPVRRSRAKKNTQPQPQPLQTQTHIGQQQSIQSFLGTGSIIVQTSVPQTTTAKRTRANSKSQTQTPAVMNASTIGQQSVMTFHAMSPTSQSKAPVSMPNGQSLMGTLPIVAMPPTSINPTGRTQYIVLTSPQHGQSSSIPVSISSKTSVRIVGGPPTKSVPIPKPAPRSRKAKVNNKPDTSMVVIHPQLPVVQAPIIGANIQKRTFSTVVPSQAPSLQEPTGTKKIKYKIENQEFALAMSDTEPVDDSSTSNQPSLVAAQQISNVPMGNFSKQPIIEGMSVQASQSMAAVPATATYMEQPPNNNNNNNDEEAANNVATDSPWNDAFSSIDVGGCQQTDMNQLMGLFDLDFDDLFH